MESELSRIGHALLLGQFLQPLIDLLLILKIWLALNDTIRVTLWNTLSGLQLQHLLNIDISILHINDTYLSRKKDFQTFVDALNPLVSSLNQVVLPLDDDGHHIHHVCQLKDFVLELMQLCKFFLCFGCSVEVIVFSQVGKPLNFSLEL